MKVIGSGVQVLPPTDLTRAAAEYCAVGCILTSSKIALFSQFSKVCSYQHRPFYLTVSQHDSHSGGHNTTFHDSILAAGEDELWAGTAYESWAEIPGERLRLLGLAQRAINTGKAAAVIFVSGDQHWAELMAKRLPSSDQFGHSQTVSRTASVSTLSIAWLHSLVLCTQVYEVTASGVPQNYDEDIGNSNRLRERSCDHAGSGPANQACVFPFWYGGQWYDDCTQADSDMDWCSTRTDGQGNHQVGNTCLSIDWS